MKNINPTKTKAWKELQQHFKEMTKIHIRDLFKENPERFTQFSITIDDKILLDYSKNRITTETMEKLQALAKATHLQDAINAMFGGEKINHTENRAVLHIALRNRDNHPILLDGKDIMPEVNKVLTKMEEFCKSIIEGEWKGYSGKSITDVVNIGIGGSYLGPYMVTEALAHNKNHLNMHFISNIDSTDILKTLKILNPETTLFLIASKTFNTQETMKNSHSAREWLLKTAKEKSDISKHFIALSTNSEAVSKFGIDIKNMFEFWDWVGGRYSLWSAVGLSIALSIGFQNFKNLLEGAYVMDKHFQESPPEKNAPILLALISIWYSNFFGAETEAILPYYQYMHLFPAYCQQGNMESNGKCVDRDGKRVTYQTGPIIWGEPGTNGQHAFYQLIHQGTKMVPCDFIASAISHNPLNNHNDILLSNFFAQTKALAFGKTLSEAIEVEKNQSYTDTDKKKEHLLKLIPYKELEGNKPTNSILLREINSFNLGMLIALYEHKIFTQGVILNIFSFDQWGVELGKQLANSILSELKDNKKISTHDSSTNSLINQFKQWRKN